MVRPSVEEERRAQLLVSTCRVIADRGIAQLRIVDVARDAGLSTGIVHYYFTSKRELIKAAFAANFADSLERRTGVLNAAISPSDKLRALIESYLPEGEPTLRAWQVWLHLWADALQDSDLQTLNDQAYGRWHHVVATVIADGQRADEFHAGDPLVLADMIVAALDGLSIQALVGSTTMTLDRMRLVCAHLVAMLVYPPARPAAIHR